MQFKRTNEFVPLFNQKVDECKFNEVNIQHAITQMPMPRPRPPLQQQQPPWAIRKGYTDCQGSFYYENVVGEENVFTTQFTLACALFRPADRLGLDRATWSSITDIVVALVPTDFSITYVGVGGGKQSEDESCAWHSL